MSDTAKADHIIFRVEPEMKATLEQMAKEDDRSLSYFVLKLVREAIEARCQKPSKR